MRGAQHFKISMF